MSVHTLALGRDTAALLQDWHAVANLIDHTLLSSTATRRDITSLCAEAKRYGFYSVMVNPAWVTLGCVTGTRIAGEGRNRYRISPGR